MLISQLMLLPVAVFCLWIFYLLSPKIHVQSTSVRLKVYNLTICLFATGLCALAFVYVVGVESGANDDIWRPVLAAVSSYLIFPSVLLFGGVARLFLFQDDAG